MEEFLKFIKRLIITAIGITILIGIPYLAGGWGWILLSWIPAILIMGYLDE